MSVQSGPHEFQPLRRFFNRGRCRHCYAHECQHPIRGWWLELRPYGDSSPARDDAVPGGVPAAGKQT